VNSSSRKNRRGERSERNVGDASVPSPILGAPTPMRCSPACCMRRNLPALSTSMEMYKPLLLTLPWTRLAYL
jgi:hypothetical protein